MRESWSHFRGWFDRRGLSVAVCVAYLAVVVAFVLAFADFYIPGKGFSSLIAFGSEFEDSRLSKIRRLDYYVEKSSTGYDAQYYVQVAMDPSLQNTQLRNAVDSLPYRARRILLPAIAYVLGFGDPASILQAYAVENMVAWLLLAVLLLHWFPPRCWENFLRWAGVMATFGLCFSLRHALTDGPSLLLVAFGLFLLEKQRPWLATGVLALSGLAKETNLLGAASLAPARLRPWSGWLTAATRGVLVAAPLALWIVYISLTVGAAADAGARNFALPGVGYIHKWREIFDTLPDTTVGELGPIWSLLMMIALTAQFLFLVLRPRWQEAWWRVGVSFALLMVFLGDAVWEGYPGAASRVLLPMQLAFNVLAPRGRVWLAVLVVGNLTLLGAPSVLRAPPGEGLVIGGPSRLLESAAGAGFKAEFGSAWHRTEQGGTGYWTWAAGNAVVTIVNPHATPVAVRLKLGLTSPVARDVQLVLNGEPVWRTSVPLRGQVTATITEIVLRPGRNELAFSTEAAAVTVSGDPRPLAFAVHNFRVDVQRLLPAEAR